MASTIEHSEDTMVMLSSQVNISTFEAAVLISCRLRLRRHLTVWARMRPGEPHNQTPEQIAR